MEAVRQKLQKELDELEDQARKDRLALAHSGRRETHAACPPFQLDGPMLAEAFANIFFRVWVSDWKEKT